MNGKCKRLGLVAMIALGFGLSAPLAPVRAQATPSLNRTALPKKMFYSKTELLLPITIDTQSQALVSKVMLFVKDGRGPWRHVQTATAKQRYFTFRAARDGEYWFTVVTIDKRGRRFPVDLSKEPPKVIVVVDTQTPTVDLQTLPLRGGRTVVRCKVIDLNPDYAKLQLDLQTPHGWRSLQRMPGSVSLYELPGGEALSGKIRCLAADLAGNTTTHIIDVKQRTALAKTPQPPKSIVPITNRMEPSLPPAPPPPTKTIAKKPAPLLPPPNSGTDSPPAKKPTELPPLPNNPLKNLAVAPPAAKTVKKFGSRARQLINTTRASIDYRIDKVGPSGVSKVDIWMKGEQADSWQRIGSDVDRRTPAEVNLPGEGLFGIRLAVTNGNGFGGRAPRSTDRPNFWIEVDTTIPFAKVQPIEPKTIAGAIDIRWTATDKNLTATPISLYYASQRQGPWTEIARNLKNTGSYRWQFPRDKGSEFFVRMEVEDAAGVRGQATPQGPVVLDLTEPSASVVGVTGVTAVRGKNR